MELVLRSIVLVWYLWYDREAGAESYSFAVLSVTFGCQEKRSIGVSLRWRCCLGLAWMKYVGEWIGKAGCRGRGYELSWIVGLKRKVGYGLDWIVWVVY